MGKSALKMLTPRSPVLVRESPETTPARIRPEDVAGALGLGKLSKGASCYLRVKETQTGEAQIAGMHSVFVYLKRKVELLSERESSGKSWPGWYERRMAHMAMVEMILPNKCPVCRGAGIARIGDKLVKICEAKSCSNGNYKYNTPSRAEYLGVDPGRAII